MLNDQINVLTAILKDNDIQEYSGDAFWKIIQAVYMGDVNILNIGQTVVEVGNDIRKILIHIPTVLFWDKMQRYMFGTFKNFQEQVKMASKFNYDNGDYAKFVKKQIHLINEINDDKKVDYFAQLTRCYLLTEMEAALFYKLASFLTMCTPEELDYIASFDFNKKTELTAMISSLYQYGLFEQHEKEHGGVDYVLSGFAKALKSNSLNFNEGTDGRDRILSYAQIAPLSIAETASWIEVMDQLELEDRS